MKWVVWTVVGFVVLLFVGMVVGGLALQTRAIENRNAYAPYSYSSSTYYGPRTGPEWDKFTEAERKGPDGYADMQALMLSNDSDVATEAAMYLSQKREPEAFQLFFEQIPKIATPVKDRLRSAWYNREVVVAAAKAIKEKGETTKEGAMTFLNLCYMRDSSGSDEAFAIVASAIPDYSGADADKLAYTVGLFRPRSHQPLIDLLDHSESRVRKTAVAALGKMEATDALAEVQKLKSDSSASVRSAALTAESSINAAISYSVSTSMGNGNENVAMQSERASAKKRLGMP